MLNSLKFDNNYIRVSLILFFLFIGFFLILIKSFVLPFPIIFGDELSYNTMAFSFYKYYNFHNIATDPAPVATNLPNFLYQLIISLSFYFNNSYIVTKVINSLLSVSFIIPFYFIFNYFSVNKLSIFLFLLTIIFLPELNYSLYVMPENLYLPLFITSYVLSFFYIVRNNNILLLVVSSLSCSLLYFTKPHAIAFISGFYISIIILFLLRYFNVRVFIKKFALHFFCVILIFFLFFIVFDIDYRLGFYSNVAKFSINSIDFKRFFLLILSHLFLILLVYGIPLSISLYIIFKRKFFRYDIVVFNVLMLSIFFIMLLMTFKYSIDISGVENYSRMHVRYYYFIFPVILLSFFINIKYINFNKSIFILFNFAIYFFGYFFIKNESLFIVEPTIKNVDNILFFTQFLKYDILFLVIFLVSSFILYFLKNYYYVFIPLLFYMMSNVYFINYTHDQISNSYYNYKKINFIRLLITNDSCVNINSNNFFGLAYMRFLLPELKISTNSECIMNNKEYHKMICESESCIDKYLEKFFKDTVCSDFGCIDIFYNPYTSGYRIMFNKYESFIKYVSGLSVIEPSGRWTDGNLADNAVITFRKKLPTSFNLELDIGAFGPNIGKNAKIKIGDKIQQFEIISASPTKYILQFNNIYNEDSIEIIPPKPTSPKELNIGEDNRKLGLFLNSLKIENVDIMKAN